VSGSADWNVYTYPGNALGLPANPYGADQFIGGRSNGDPAYGRAQRDFAFENHTYGVSYDICTSFNGVLPATDNIGSFSLQPSATAAFWQSLQTWYDYNNPTTWRAWYLCFDATGTQWTAPGKSPGPAWDNLPINHWYRQFTLWDFTTNMVTAVGIRDLTTGDESWYYPTDWYLAGGAGGGKPLPTAFRFFVGGATAGDIQGIDNVNLIPEPGLIGFVALGVLGAFGLRRRR
jgi:hypothetical protein